MNTHPVRWTMLSILLIGTACNESKPDVKLLVKDMNLKRGPIISCGPEDQKLGTVSFAVSCGETVQESFQLGVKLLHSFEYDEAEKVFADVVDKNEDCAMGYWGIAMSNFHPLWTPPTAAELEKGARAVEIAKSLRPSGREADYVAAIDAFYADHSTVDHRTRCLRFEKAMESLHQKYPDDREATIFYSLSLVAAADPTDKTYAKQKKAGDILNSLYPGQPDHPGIVHYIIHTYDAPELAEKALPAARKYASVAPSSAHALHMPSHIFTRLGLWDECIQSNLASVNSAQCYAKQAGMKGHWDEELHGLDYLVYAYLQKGDNTSARNQLEYVLAIDEVHPSNFKVAYSFAAVPCRYALENRLWKEAAALELPYPNMDWNMFPWQKGMLNFTHILGAVHTGQMEKAESELAALKSMQERLVKEKDVYKAGQLEIQVNAGEAWLQWKKGAAAEAERLMVLAASLEDKTEKHPVTPGELLPARELLGDLYMQLNQPAKALEAYEASLATHPNRFNGLYGAGIAAKRAGNKEKAAFYFNKLKEVAPNSTRPEMKELKL